MDGLGINDTGNYDAITIRKGWYIASFFSCRIRLWEWTHRVSNRL